MVIMFVLIEIDQFYTYFVFSECYIFCYRGNLRSYAWLEKNGVYEALPLFFARNTSDCSYLLKFFIRVAFFSNIFINP